jgi:hypothetical protein
MHTPSSQRCFYLIFLLYLCTLAACTAANESEPGQSVLSDSASLQVIFGDQPADMPGAIRQIDSAKKMLTHGCLVTRSDNDFESLTLQNFSKRERVYSHSGIALKQGDSFYIYHCMGGSENPDGQFKREPFDSFVSPYRKTGFGIFAYQLNAAETDQFAALITAQHQQKIPFDITFNLANSDSLYCSEMIYKNLRKASNNRIVLPTSVMNNFKPKILGYKYNRLFFKTFEYIGIDDLYLNPFCKEVLRVKYK